MGDKTRWDSGEEMEHLLEAISRDLTNPRSVIGALFLGAVFLGFAVFVSGLLRRAARRAESRLTDVTGLRFFSLFGQLLIYLIAFILYAHLVPDLRALGTALLAGASVISVVIGFAAQNTLGNLIAGLSLVLYRPIRVGDKVQLNSPKGLVTAKCDRVALGFTIFIDDDKHEIIVPNSVMVSSTVIRLERTRLPSDGTGG